MSELLGQRIGAYDLIAYLGEGAHVHAYLARESANGRKRKIVIKVLKSTLVGTPEFQARFEREAKAALELSHHPNIVQMHGYAQEGDMLYIVEEFLPGGSLMDILRQNPGPLPMEKTIKTLEQIAAGLDFAHERGVIHGDLKPENVLYTAGGVAKLSDLGITKDRDQKAALSRDGLMFGNPGYMSPEEWQGKPADARTDIYALGILLFEMLTGQLPFDNVFRDSLAFVHLMHLVSKPLALTSLRPDLPYSVEAVITKAMEKDRENRYATAGEMVRAFKEALANPDVVPPPQEVPEPIAPPSSATFNALAARLAIESAKPETPISAPPAAPSPAPLPELRRAPAAIPNSLLILLLGVVIGFIVARLLDALEDALDD